jgi:hypothetical protein
VLFALSNLHITPGYPTRSRLRRKLRRKRDGLLVSLAPGHHRPCHPGHLVRERDSSDFGGSAGKELDDLWPLRAVPLGISDHRQGSDGQH